VVRWGIGQRRTEVRRRVVVRVSRGVRCIGGGGGAYGDVGGGSGGREESGKVAYVGFTERGVLSIQSICVVVDSQEGLFRIGMKFGLMYIKD
jgi:hypothetical protein